MLFINDKGGYESQSDREDEDSYEGMPGLEENDNEGSEGSEDIITADDVRVMVTMRSLSIKIEEETIQRQNIFHTKYLINNQVCLLVIDSGSCINVISTLLVDQLGLKTTEHLNPYTLQWLSERGEIRVSKQVLITFSIEKYKDEVLCDVAPIEVGHLLLGRP